MIIITGVDNSGKTTLATHLSNKFHIPIIDRYHELPPQDYDDWYRWVVGVLDRDYELIADRFYLDELVYGPVVRNKIGISQHQIKVVDGLLAEQKPLIILCHRMPGDIESTYNVRKQYLDISQISEIQIRYFRLVQGFPFKELTVGYSIEDDPYYEQIDFEVQMYLKAQEVLKNERK